MNKKFYLGGQEFLKWTLRNLSLPRQRRWKFPRPLLSIYLCEAPAIAIQKPVQKGISTYCLARAFHAMAPGPPGKLPVNILYVLPSKPNCIQFVRSKVDPIVMASPMLRSLLDRNVDSTFMKKFGESLLVLDGAGAASQTTVFDADILVLDEWSYLPEDVRSLYEGRTAGSELGLKLWVSTPFVQGEGIDYLLSDCSRRLVWHVRCRSCSEVVPLDPLDYHRIVRREAQIPHFVCPACSKPLDPEDPDAREVRGKGRFLPTRSDPGHGITGFLYSSLYESNVGVEELIREEESYRMRGRAADFYRLVLGIPPPTSKEQFELTRLRTLVMEEAEVQKLRKEAVVVGVDQSHAGFTAVALAATKEGFILLDAEAALPVEATVSFIERLSSTLVIADRVPEVQQAVELCARLRVQAYLAQAQTRPAGSPWLFLRNDVLFFEPNMAYDELFAFYQSGGLKFSSQCQLLERLFREFALCERQLVERTVAGFRRTVATWRWRGELHLLHATLLALLGLVHCLRLRAGSVALGEPSLPPSDLFVVGAEEEERAEGSLIDFLAPEWQE